MLGAPISVMTSWIELELIAGCCAVAGEIVDGVAVLPRRIGSERDQPRQSPRDECACPAYDERVIKTDAEKDRP